MSYRGPNQFNNHFGGANGVPPPTNLGPVSSSKSPLDQFEDVSKKVEELIDSYCKPLKPYVPAIGRAFIVATFLEDSLRIISQWSEQVYYLHNYRHIWRWFTLTFLFFNVITMLTASTLLVLRKHSVIATSTLVAVVFCQGLAYGLIFDGQFILRNLSVVGGLVLAFSDSLVRDKRSLNMPGLPMLDNQDNKKYFLLAGRLLLIFLFLGFVFSASWSVTRVFIILIGVVSCGSIVVGYKTKFAAFILTVLLFTYNVFVNTFWKYGALDSNRDFLKYEFFQTLSIVGGLLIIVNAGAGELSIDEKKKIY
ncbi:SURF4-domain-containing protein [Suhomyces tanzawaensis NRRL Y-17324]|uniref:SURF4-domain-containing protein n=1 Tax=Suhomyces tanzawaensis NRRL Y-17324 TaxID=984487 RepID=A0A1E4SM90_9ASCO|nr:SURF4-domain-containing protein [Suhomyces tanzawaensis NRRL Y-17324]ODV80605.1 SURF4-domain-containing protein [Suhomyces tanzawaensis NRRL Y-17324]